MILDDLGQATSPRDWKAEPAPTKNRPQVLHFFVIKSLQLFVWAKESPFPAIWNFYEQRLNCKQFFWPSEAFSIQKGEIMTKEIEMIVNNSL